MFFLSGLHMVLYGATCSFPQAAIQRQCAFKEEGVKEAVHRILKIINLGVQGGAPKIRPATTKNPSNHNQKSVQPQRL